MDIASIRLKIYKLKYWLIGIFVVFFMLAIGWITNQGLDPDFGWHLRMGQVILSKGIPRIDPFSYTMPRYPFVDHEWLTNVGIALLHPGIGLIGLSIVFTLLAYASLLLQFPLALKKWVSIPLLLCISSISSYLGIRPQIISWFLFSLLLLLLLQKQIWDRWRFFLPLLFVIWTNLHGGFPLGIGIFFIVLVIRSWQDKKQYFLHWILFAFCLGITFINPYGYRMWWEIWVSLADSSLHWSIQEWVPTLFILNFGLIALLPFSVILIFLTRKRFSLTELVVYSVLLIFGLSSARNLPFWLILAFPLTVRAIGYMSERVKHIQGATERFHKAYAVYLLFVIAGVSWQAFSPLFVDKKNAEESYYPQQAVTYLRQHPSSGQLFSEYGWGGYLIWKLPEKKVFIDGRMPSWRWDAASIHESSYAFRDYQDVLTGKLSFARIAQKYHIDTALVLASREKNTFTWGDMLEKWMGLDQVTVDFKTQMRKAGMKLIYKDTVAAIYRKK